MGVWFGGIVVDDQAYSKALLRRSELLAQLKELQDELGAVEDFIALHDRLFGTRTSGAEAEAGEGKRRPQERNLIPPARLAALAREVILERGRPMIRSEIVEALEARGIPLAGKNRAKNLGTILWRFGDRFHHIEGRGYWPSDVPLND